MPIGFYKHVYGPISPRPAKRVLWPHFDLFWVHAGRMTLEFESGSECRMDAGRGVLVYPGTPFHWGRVDRPGRASVQHFKLEEGPELPELLRAMLSLRDGYEPVCATTPAIIDAMIASAMRLAELPSGPYLYDMRVAQLTLILGELKRARQIPLVHEDPLRRLLDRLEKNPTTQLTLAEMASASGLSVSHFRALFRVRQGQSPVRFLQSLRMREAARLLRETEWPIKQIAQQFGFSQLPHFYRSFKSTHGVTPARYRKEQVGWT